MERTASFTIEDALAEMAQCQLGDKRRTDRLVHSAQLISRHPSGSLPQKLKEPSDYRATLRLANCPDVTHQAVLEPHIQATRERMRLCTDTVLIVEDIVELDYSKQMTLSSMGQIGNGGGWGYLCHNSLAVNARTGELLGLAAQQLHNRVRRPKNEGVASSRERDTRESLLWINAGEQIGLAPENGHWVDVCDRGADTFEFLEFEIRQGRHFVIRSSHSRALEVETDAEPHLLHDRMRSLQPQLGWYVAVSANQKQPARRAKLQCSWAEVSLKAPHVHRGKHGRDSVKVWAIRVWEVEAPPEVKEPLEWLLLSDEPIGDGEAARQRVSYYERRPRVEEYHKAQKTGMGIEQLQLQSQAGIQPLIALLSVVAVALVNAREAARDESKAGSPAVDFFDPLAVRVLSVWRYQAYRELTVREFILALGRLGGHQNRKCDGLPGWLTLLRGTIQLNAMVEYELARSGAGPEP